MDLSKIGDILELVGAAVVGLPGVFIALRAVIAVLDKLAAMTPSKWDDSALAKAGRAIEESAAWLDAIARNLPVLRRKP